MIFVKSKDEIDKMRLAGRITRDTLNLLMDSVKEGMTTKKLDNLARHYIESSGATPSFLNYNGYPASVCISIDDEVVHGIPTDKRFIEEGQLVSFDVGAFIGGYHGDAARSVLIGRASEDKKRLIKVTEECFYKGIEKCVDGNRLGDVGEAIQRHAEENGYSVVRELVGHGIGQKMHEDPSVPNFGKAGRGVRLCNGMTIAVEPMINMGKKEVWFLDDEWTVVTRDGMPSAHYENTIAITENGVEILTL